MTNVVVPPPGTPVPTGGVPLSGTYTANWQNDILNLIGAPITANTQEIMNAWNACEGNNPLPNGSGIPINNPFNTTLAKNPKTGVSYGGKGINGPGVQAYPTPAVGIQATVDTMLYTPAFQPIVAALRNNAPRSFVAAAIGASGWGTGGSCVASANGKVASGAIFPGDSPDLSGQPGGPGSGGDLGAAVPGLNIPIASWTDTLGKILTALTTGKFWIRVGYGVLGFALIVAGLVFMLSESSTAQSVAKTATTAALEA